MSLMTNNLLTPRDYSYAIAEEVELRADKTTNLVLDVKSEPRASTAVESSRSDAKSLKQT